MHEVARADWSAEERELWCRIGAHPFECKEHALDFTARLARDRGWSLDFARGAVAEYRRFCFLAMVFDTPVTPSEEVDEVWHQHLTYSRDYWERWCGQALGAPLHHDPTAGGPAEQARYRGRYAETLARYEAYFGPPDPAFWPGTRQRFRPKPRYRIVDEDRVWLLPRPKLRLGPPWGLLGWFGRVAGALALWLAAPPPVQALPLNPLDWTAGPFLTLQACLAAASLLGALFLRERMRRAGPMAPPASLDVVELAYLAGGPERACDAVVIGLVDAGAASYGSQSGIVTVEDRRVPLPRHLERFRDALTDGLKRPALLRAFKPRLDAVRDRLVRAALSPSDSCLHRMRLTTLALVGPVLLFGLAKIVVGLERDRPVGFLVVLTIATAVLGLVILLHRPTRTGAGDAALDRYRQRQGRAARAPRAVGDEVLIAFALGGGAALAGTSHEAYGRAMRASASDGSGCGSSGDGGGDGGGGGCGGCGGGGD